MGPGKVQYDTVGYGTKQYNGTRYGKIQYGTAGYGMLKFNTVGYGAVRYDAEADVRKHHDTGSNSMEEDATRVRSDGTGERITR